MKNTTKPAVIVVLVSLLVASCMFSAQARPQSDFCSSCCHSWWTACMSQHVLSPITRLVHCYPDTRLSHIQPNGEVSRT
ncbi:hypothetical protein ACROYT_G020426 [Oculina patagonica]